MSHLREGGEGASAMPFRSLLWSNGGFMVCGCLSLWAPTSTVFIMFRHLPAIPCLLLLFCDSPTQPQNSELLLYGHKVNPSMWHLYVWDTSLKRTGSASFIITLKENWEELVLLYNCAVSLMRSHRPKLHVRGAPPATLNRHIEMHSLTGPGWEFSRRKECNWRKRGKGILSCGLSDRSWLVWTVGKNDGDVEMWRLEGLDATCCPTRWRTTNCSSISEEL